MCMSTHTYTPSHTRITFPPVSLSAAGDGTWECQVSISVLFPTVMRCVVSECVQKERKSLVGNGAVAA